MSSDDKTLDQAPNTVETLLGSNPASNASDGDGVSDRYEVLVHTTSPISTDTDVALGACGDRIEIVSTDGTSSIAFADLIQFAGAYTSTGPAAAGGETGTWDANKDYDSNSTVGLQDLIIFAGGYTQACGAGVDLAP